MTSVSSPMRRPGDDHRAPASRREPRDALPAGTVLGDAYRVERTLGQGGFGIVYLATDLALQRPMAIKEYLPVQLAGRGEGASIGLREAAHKDAFLRGLQSFLREARLLAQFDHPSLVRVYRFWEENHTAYMAMPYCEGPTLYAARQTMLRPPDENWLRERLLVPLLGALQTLHEGQCLHRDVSPGNIILKLDGQPVLLDFGSARRVVADMTQPLTAILNPSYAAIEQYAESSTLPQGPWTDLYGLAAVAYFALSGRAPVPATVRAVNEAAMMPVAEVAHVTERSFPGLHFSAPFLAAVDRALAVRPADRPQSAQAMREALLSPHVQPDVTIEGPPLQAVPLNKAADAAAGAEGGNAPTGADPEEAEAEKAIRAAIDAALADVDDWPPMSRGRGQPPRVEPQFAPAAPAAPSFANAGKATLKVVPGGEGEAKPRAEPVLEQKAAKTAEPPVMPAGAPAPAQTAPEAWAATAPIVSAMQVMQSWAASPSAAASAPAGVPKVDAPAEKAEVPAPAVQQPSALREPQPASKEHPAPKVEAQPEPKTPAQPQAASHPKPPVQGFPELRTEVQPPAQPQPPIQPKAEFPAQPPAQAEPAPAAQAPVPPAVPTQARTETPAPSQVEPPAQPKPQFQPPESRPAPATASEEPAPPQPALAEVIAFDTAVPTEPMPDAALDLGSFHHALDSAPQLPARRSRAGAWLAAAALAGLVAVGAWYGLPRPDQTPQIARAPVPVEKPAATAETAPPVSEAANPERTPVPAASSPVVAAAPVPAPAPAATPAPAPTPTAEAAAPEAPAAAASAAPDTAVATDAAPERTPRTTANSSGTTAPPPRTASRKSSGTAVASTAHSAARSKPTVRSTTSSSGTATAAKAGAADPRSACGTRTNFSLYYCMKAQCRQPRFSSHPQCQRLRENDEVS